MNSPSENVRVRLPSVDYLLQHQRMAKLIKLYGRPATTDITRDVLADLRQQFPGGSDRSSSEDAIMTAIAERLEVRANPNLRPVFNLTGTVLHTNLGRAPLPESALEAITLTARGASNLEFDLETGRRGDRDAIVEERLCRLTGAEAATVVNNNAAAVMLLLNSLANRKEVPVSRGELV
ncbi:MAG: L-seryl-tRNA(Sec) selenium transferase, partial [Alphaproteobacteria bacterium MarineAlpha4_Bin2]